MVEQPRMRFEGRIETIMLQKHLCKMCGLDTADERRLLGHRWKRE